ncbi:hypothetical protein FA15DRAFT_605144 [Coprinopsis marcescibilis]|uniref:CBM21 domain-containing protein n=1 Tax=Coprinopsis marcescibilis TaxID=230819 RepID=A0A5C3KBD4_COPMA|nr:hypothetical protein FA15DRAFT_605144 [Coprinopsis marcescibilis]
MPAASPATSSIRRSSSSSSSSDSESNSNSGSQASSTPFTQAPLSFRARRARGPNPPIFPDALSTTALTTPSRPKIDGLPAVPAPSGLRASKTEDNIIVVSEKRGSSSSSTSSRPLIYSPGVSLRLGFSPAISQGASRSAVGRSVDDSRLIRKKSGQLVKPSLKTSRSAGDGVSGFGLSSKSEPATPVCKAVHFDSQLEHVKLFLSEQKPLAVSRDGSPTDDTSGTDSDFPSFIFGEQDEQQRKRRKLTIDVVNMPCRINNYSDVALEELKISNDSSSILGSVRVRNIAFSKTVAIRFTFDFWQTTSEVTGHYTESLSPELDRFVFNIKLTDMLARIEEKTLIAAVRYTVAGQELWDNNNALNYVAKFTMSVRDRSLSDDEDSSTNLASLHTKLEKVVETKERTGPAFLAQNTRLSVEPEQGTPAFKSTSSLASRYDFSASLKIPWRYQDNAQTHHRTNSYPQFSKPSLPLKPANSTTKSPSIAQPTPAKRMPLGSPRDLSEGAIPTVPASAHDDTPFDLPSSQALNNRNHRRGYFDLSTFSATDLKRTPPTSPPTIHIPENDQIDSFLLGDSHNFGPKMTSPFPDPPKSAPLFPTAHGTGLGVHSLGGMGMGSFGLFPADNGFDSEVPTPLLGTPSSSRATTPSPTEPFVELPSVSDGDQLQSPGSDTNYQDLISQYCFFTGSGTGPAKPQTLGTTTTTPSQVGATASIVRQYSLPDSASFGSAATPKFPAASRMGGLSMSSPFRSSSADDIVSLRSGSITPTASRMDFMNDLDSRASTPVPT